MRKIWTGGTQLKDRHGVPRSTKVAGPVVLSEAGWRFVPCGKCAFCLTNRRSQWMFRIHYEMKNQNVPGYFMTLTYDEKHVRRVGGMLSLRFRDIQLYLKRLRKAKFYAKYICVGEYGSNTNRPHYHMLLWTDAPIKFLEQNWKSSKDNSVLGAIHFGRLTMQSAMYTLKYIIQPKQVLDPIESVEHQIEPTRAQFSKGLGIGFLSAAQYDHLTSDFDNPIMFSYIDGRKVAIPRYYRNKIYTKLQSAKYAIKAKWDAIRNRRKYMRELIAQGVVGTKKYINSIRAEQARRIISKTKNGEKL